MVGAFNPASVSKQIPEQSLQITTFSSYISTLSQILQSRDIIAQPP
ncbi:MAG TPA: hypothetical protein VFH25_07850 [Nitrososphaeraceae archaeon]|nr:hypothetical protein [Nitrososphaeraceae archaeon]